ncbi:MAG: ArsA family ATPase [Anaerolineales bacterium]
MTKFIFFSGKGGVGKTSMACTHAVRYADEGKRTLIVTTDPASNLADVFEQEIGHQVTPIAAVPNLFAMEIDPDKATQEYIDRAMSPHPRRLSASNGKSYRRTDERFLHC